MKKRLTPNKILPNTCLSVPLAFRKHLSSFGIPQRLFFSTFSLFLSLISPPPLSLSLSLSLSLCVSLRLHPPYSLFLYRPFAFVGQPSFQEKVTKMEDREREEKVGDIPVP